MLLQRLALRELPLPREVVEYEIAPHVITSAISNEFENMIRDINRDSAVQSSKQWTGKITI